MNTSIDNILEKYWEGTSSIEEETHLRVYFRSDTVSEQHKELIPLFGFLDQERELSIGDNYTPEFTSASSAKNKIRFLFPQLIAIAASALILISIGMHFYNSNDTMYKNKYTELQDPDEALAITMEALGFLSNKYESGSQPMTKYMKNFEQTSIVKLN